MVHTTKTLTRSPEHSSLLAVTPKDRNEGSTIYEQTGWIRPHPQTICQDLDVLERITLFNYVLTADFVKYFEARTGVRITQCDCGFRHVAEVLANPDIPLSEIPDHWQLTRAKMQDAWELFRNTDRHLVQSTIESRDKNVEERWRLLTLKGRKEQRKHEEKKENEFLSYVQGHCV